MGKAFDRSEAFDAADDIHSEADIDIEAELDAWAEAERERLGLKSDRKQWVDTMLESEMSRDEREHVTLLMGGLTAAQDFLVEGALRSLGYKAVHLDAPDQAALQVGKEYGNRGQCNPTYFTVGNLVKYLVDLRDEQGMSTEEIIRSHIFFTAGACGPCRFGMYVTEYRKALRDAGFDGFRVMMFQQQGGLSQATGEESGLEFNPAFFVGIIKGIVCGDVLNALAYRVRPYEVNPGETNRVFEESKRIVYRALLERTNVFAALYKCRKLFAEVEVDRLRVRPKVAIIGEFWAMTTEGDGNYHLQRFLEQEGAENYIQLTTAWLLYNVWEVERDTRVRTGLDEADEKGAGLAGMDDFDVGKRMAALRFAEYALRIGFQAFAQPVGLHGYHMPDMDKIAEVADGYYSNDLRGGEGHMEVGKLILNVVEQHANMTLSVKPFGCMPSSGVSDGVQSLISARYPGTIFCAVETSGDGATNFYSRVLMYLFKARIAAEQELETAYEKTGVTEAEVRAFLAAHPRYNSALHYPPHTVSSTAANLVYEVAPLIRQGRLERAAGRIRRGVTAAKAAARTMPNAARRAVAFARDPETHERLREDVAILRDMVGGKLGDRLGPLAEKLLGRAVAGEGSHAPEESLVTLGEPPERLSA